MLAVYAIYRAQLPPAARLAAYTFGIAIVEIVLSFLLRDSTAALLPETFGGDASSRTHFVASSSRDSVITARLPFISPRIASAEQCADDTLHRRVYEPFFTPKSYSRAY